MADKLDSTFDGADGATAFLDPIAGAYTFGGNAQLDTAQKKEGSASLLLDGTGDSVTVQNAAYWKFLHTTNARWTIDMWLKLADFAADRMIINTAAGSSAEIGIYLFLRTSRALEFAIVNGSSGQPVITQASLFTYPNSTDWNHIAITCDLSLASANVKGAINGVFGAALNKTGYAPSASDPTYTFVYGTVAGIGTDGLYGWTDRLRVCDTIRWASDFTPPVNYYQSRNQSIMF